MHRGENPAAIIGALFDGVRELCGGGASDDMTAIVIKVGGAAPDFWPVEQEVSRPGKNSEKKRGNA